MRWGAAMLLLRYPHPDDCPIARTAPVGRVSRCTRHTSVGTRPIRTRARALRATPRPGACDTWTHASDVDNKWTRDPVEGQARPEDNSTLLSSDMLNCAPGPPGTHQHHHWPGSHGHPHPHYALPPPPPPPVPVSTAPPGHHLQPTTPYSHPEPQEASGQEQHQRTSIKRPLSDSDCDDVFSEESGKEPCNSPGGDSCQHTSRKRRRGMIEKKRRDRINASLGELRRLVPAAARDPHSGKLEKAEILQLTVEHLRTLRNKGAEGYDSTKLAMDYHAVGWGECVAEVGRYLVTMEGLDERDPLRLRLLSHLQSFHRDQPQQQQQSQPQPQQQASYEQSNVQPNLQPSPAWPPSQYSASPGQYPGQYSQQQHGKPYRPWGAELAY